MDSSDLSSLYTFDSEVGPINCWTEVEPPPSAPTGGISLPRHHAPVTLQFGDDWAILPQGYATLLEGLDPKRLNIKFDSPVVRVSVLCTMFCLY